MTNTRSRSPSSRWTRRDERNALAQGWGLFRVDSGDIVIQKMDEPGLHPLWAEPMPEEEVFASDNAAIRFVRRKAREGDRTAQKAIARHDANIARWRRFKRFAGY